MKEKKRLKRRIVELEIRISDLDADILTLLGNDKVAKKVVKARWMLSEQIKDEIWK
jgi:hypothetical protein